MAVKPGVVLVVGSAAALLVLANKPSDAGASNGTLKPGTVPAAYVRTIQDASRTCSQVSAPLLAAQLDQESGFDPTIVSPAGAEGIAQFMPGTWPDWAKDDDGTHRVSAFNPNDAIMAMARYDCALAGQTAHVPGNATDNMLAAYNAGPKAVLDNNGIPPYAETQTYVASIETAVPHYAGDAPHTQTPEVPAHHWWDQYVADLKQIWHGATTDAAGSAAPSDFAQREIRAASHYLGTPYVWGGGTPTGPSNGGSGDTKGFDCSGLVLYAVYQASGGQIELPHFADDQAHLGAGVDRGNLRPGDVIAFKLNGSPIYDHIVIYAGGGNVITAPETGEVVRIQTLASFGNVPMAIRRFG